METKNVLQTTYEALFASSDPAQRKILEQAQKAWELFVEHQCAFHTFGSIGGTMHSVALMECQSEMARIYTELLQRQLYCEEGNLSCSIPSGSAANKAEGK
ncbi:MAG: DUF1311 domain-containing protein [Hyphomicrobiales bacterium]|nr:DUF1311 domain-containing protein [Hyphomicrobiales bacterium]